MFVIFRRWKRSTEEIETIRKTRAIDSVYEKFPLLNRQDSFYQKFDVFFVGGGVSNRSGFLGKEWLL